MSKSIITTTSAAFLLMSSVAFAGSNLDEGSIQALGNQGNSGSAADIALSSRSSRGNSAGSGSNSNQRAKDMAMEHQNEQAMLVLEAYLDGPRGGDSTGGTDDGGNLDGGR